jgi:hypothetical protein
MEAGDFATHTAQRAVLEHPVCIPKQINQLKSLDHHLTIMVTSAVFVHLQLAPPSPVTPSVSHCSTLFFSSGPSEPCAPAYPLSSQWFPCTSPRFSLSPFFSHYSELFRPFTKTIPFLFKQIRTLSAKHPGCHTPASDDLPISLPAPSFPLPSTFDFQLSTLPCPRPISRLSPFLSKILQTPFPKSLSCTDFQKTPGGWGLYPRHFRTASSPFPAPTDHGTRGTDHGSRSCATS